MLSKPKTLAFTFSEQGPLGLELAISKDNDFKARPLTRPDTQASRCWHSERQSHRRRQ